MSRFTIKVKKYRCDNCLKYYESKIFYERHRNTCEILSKTQKERNLDYEICQDIPSNKQLFELVKTLLIEQSTMKKEIEKLKRYQNTQIKKIDVFDYLNNKIKPTIIYSEWIKSLVFTNDDLQFLLEETYVNTMNMYLENLFANIDEESNLPIRAFTEKQNILYIYDYCEEEENELEPKLMWIKLNEDHWKAFMKQISKKVFDKFKEWQDDNEDRFEEESFSIKYHTNVKKIMSNIGLPMINLQKKVFNLIKLDFKNISTSYEIE
jgi:hypothetical protein